MNSQLDLMPKAFGDDVKMEPAPLPVPGVYKFVQRCPIIFTAETQRTLRKRREMPGKTMRLLCRLGGESLLRAHLLQLREGRTTPVSAEPEGFRVLDPSASS